MNSGIQLLPPKTAALYAQKAKEGKADRVFGQGSSACYEFDQGDSRNVVVLVSLDPPIGYVARKLSTKKNV